MNPGNRVFLGDLVRALSKAGDTASNNWTTVAAMLGFGFVEPRPEVSTAVVVLVQPVAKPPGDATDARATGDSSATASGDGDIGELLEFDLARSTSPPQAIVLDTTVSAERPAGSYLPPRTLLDPLWERGILIEAAGMPNAEGDIDVPQAVNLFARGAALREMPALKIRSVSKGCQVLIDAGMGMQPFASDTRRFVTSIRNAVGADHTRVLTFVDCPTNGVMAENFSDAPYTPPDNGAVVLALTDLCGGGPRSAIREAGAEDWLIVAKVIRDAGSALVVLNPYPRDRWPASVAQQVAIVRWDTGTRAADVRYTRRRIPR